VKAAIDSGDIRKDLEPFDLLRALIGVSNVATGPEWQESARRLLDILIKGFAANEVAPGDLTRIVVYYRPIFLISFLQEVFLRSVILFQPDFCFISKELRFRLRSFEFRRCGKVDKKNRRSLKICLGA
jgi:hypothetical protein